MRTAFHSEKVAFLMRTAFHSEKVAFLMRTRSHLMRTAVRVNGVRADGIEQWSN